MKFPVLVTLALALAATALPAPPTKAGGAAKAGKGGTNAAAKKAAKGGAANAGNAGTGKGGNAAKGAAGNDTATATNANGGDATTAAASVAAATGSAAATAGNAAAAANATAAAGGDPQASLTLDPAVIATGFANNGQDVPTAGQVASLTSSNNFINFCLTVPQLPIMNGKQIQGGACNPAPMGALPSTKNMPSSKFTFPKNGQTIAANNAFTITMAIQNLATGNFVNAQENYYSAPQQLNGQGQIIGHSHVVVEKLDAIDQTTPTDPNVFAFFKGLNDAAQGGVLSASVDKGLPAGVYRLASINAAANHQPVLVPVAQHGTLDDVVYFTVSDNAAAVASGANSLSGAAAGNDTAAGAASNSTASTSTASNSTASTSTASNSTASTSTASTSTDTAAATGTGTADAAAATDTGAAAAGKGGASATKGKGNVVKGGAAKGGASKGAGKAKKGGASGVGQREV